MATVAAPKTPTFDKVTIRSWPKMFFLYPSVVIALIMGIGEAISETQRDIWGAFFLVTLVLNLTVLTFEFPRATTLTLVVAVFAVVFGVGLLESYFQILPGVGRFLASLHISASRDFYIFFVTLSALLFIGMYVVTRFDYWELSANELVHHRGFLGDLERFSTSGLKINKEITDIFEYAIGNAGTLVLSVPGTPRPIVLENVIGLSSIIAKADVLLNARVVRVEQGLAAAGQLGQDAASIAQRAEEDMA